jgi:hypothetical protein
LILLGLSHSWLRGNRLASSVIVNARHAFADHRPGKAPGNFLAAWA